MASAATDQCNSQVDHLPGVHWDELDAPKHLARRVHELYFAPQHEEFQPRVLIEARCIPVVGRSWRHSAGWRGIASALPPIQSRRIHLPARLWFGAEPDGIGCV